MDSQLLNKCNAMLASRVVPVFPAAIGLEHHLLTGSTYHVCFGDMIGGILGRGESAEDIAPSLRMRQVPFHCCKGHCTRSSPL